MMFLLATGNSMTHLYLNQSRHRRKTSVRISRSFIVCVFAVSHALVSGLVPQCSAQETLPPENQIPGIQGKPLGQLPNESMLPGNQNGADANLPSEQALPGQSGKQFAEVDMSAPIGGKAPILRLAFDGHTGLVRTLDISDGGRTLITGGEDKDVHVWRQSEFADSGWIHRRTIRWPVSRGPRGSVLATATRGDLVAFAGRGAFGYRGEIRIVNAASSDLEATLVDLDRGHRANVLSMAWSPGKKLQLASIDMSGKLMLWSPDPNSGLWVGKALNEIDEQTYGKEIARWLTLAERRGFVPVTFLGDSHLVLPRYVGPSPKNNQTANWHLQRIDLRTMKSDLLKDFDHTINVRSLSSSDDGRVLVSCEQGEVSGELGVWHFDDQANPVSFKRIQTTPSPVTVEVTNQGRWLLVGTEKPLTQANAEIQLWDITGKEPKRLSSKAVSSDSVRSATVDMQNRNVVASQGSHAEVYKFDADGVFAAEAPKQLAAPAKAVIKVAFAKQKDRYRIGFGWTRDANGKKRIENVFDLSSSQLDGRQPIDSADFISTQRGEVPWTVGVSQGRYQIYEGDQPRGILPLLPSVDTKFEAIKTVCTLPETEDGKSDVGAVIIGTSGRNNIYAYRANASDPPELLRQFRGHRGEVLSVSTSPDGKYLASGSQDTTIAIWNLQDIYTSTRSVNRWGCDFEIEGDQLIAMNVREDGPLYFRGVRGGDAVSVIKWTSPSQEKFAESAPDKMRKQLLELPFSTQVAFEFTRLKRRGPSFQSLPAWRPLATLFVDQSREWAFWTPAGYYDASFNGHQNFGWQINKSIDQPVEYYRASQFRKALERPEVMRRLMTAGSLPAAMRKTLAQIGPPPAEGAIVTQIQSRPKITLLSPEPGSEIVGETLSVIAEIAVPTGATLVDPKAFVSGVPATNRQVIVNRRDAPSNVVTYQWDFRLPRDPLLQLEVLAATEAEAVARVMVDLDHQSDRDIDVKPRLHVLAIGASQYRDPQIQSLDFAAEAAGRISELFQTQAADLYRTSTDQLVNDDATRPMWRVFAKNAAEQLSKTVSPDDLVIMYLCGHGLRDRRNNEWYFITADARYSDLMNDQYDDCIAFSDLAALSKLPCRKLAILDSCHSGAVQPLMRSEDLKSCLRFLQDDVVLTFTASEGAEEAAEQREVRMGRFTATLVDALSGEADKSGNGDGTVTLKETIAYVSRRVSTESEAEGMPQHPTASPNYLLRTLMLPLTASETQ